MAGKSRPRLAGLFRASFGKKRARPIELLRLFPRQRHGRAGVGCAVVKTRKNRLPQAIQALARPGTGGEGAR